VVAFARGDRHVTLVPRLVLGLERAGGWRDTVVELPDGAWRNLFTDEVAGGAAPLVDVLHDFPVALLERA
jgi:(1->4)-alpha-D-glucan 1-alpha-D-glucosylmutase